MQDYQTQIVHVDTQYITLFFPTIGVVHFEEGCAWALGVLVDCDVVTLIGGSIIPIGNNIEILPLDIAVQFTFS